MPPEVIVPPLPAVADEPPAGSLYRHSFHVITALRELWRNREVMISLTERGLRSRYKQTTLGFAWALITPVSLMVVFTLFFKRIAHVDTGDVPYPIYSYVGLLPWTLFSGAVSGSGTVLISNASLLNKVYCPREIFPLSAVAIAVVDTLCAVSALVVLMAIDGFAPAATTYWAVPLVAVLLVFTVAVSLLLSSITVYLRDVRYALPIVLQLGLFATPIAYRFDSIPAGWRPLYSIVNPLGPVIDGLRRSVLDGRSPELGLLLCAAASSVVLLAVSFVVFKRLEPGFADVS